MVANMNDLSALIAADLNSSNSSRQNLGGGGTAFGWGSDLPPSIAAYVTVATASGMSVPVTIVGESGTPVAPVGAGSNKPLAVAVSSDTLSLAKHAGYAEVQLETQLDAAGIYPAVTSVLSAGAVKSYEAAAMTAIAAGAAAAGTGATWLEAIYAGQGAILANGGRPSVLALSALDYGTIMAEIAASPGYALDPSSAAGVFAGSTLHFSSGLASGDGFVLDPAAVLSVQHEQSPIVSVDTSGINNTARVVADLIAGTVVTSPAHVADLTVTV